MVGEALTVFQGSKPEPFKVRVVSVLRNFLPKQDVILIRAEDPRVEHSGIVAGMSGSPVYIDGKLVGAVAYAWSFAKEPLGGVTPIETMLGRARAPAPLGQGSPRRRLAGAQRRARAKAAASSTAACRTRRWRRTATGPRALARGLGLPPTAPTIGAGEPRLLRASVPLSVVGLHARARSPSWPTRSRPTGLVPLQAGGGRKLGPARRRPRRARIGDRRRAGARRHEHGRDRHRHLRRRPQRARVRPPAVRHRRGLPADGRRADSRLPPQPGAVVQDVVAAERGRHAGAGPAVVHHRRSRRAHARCCRSTCASAAPASSRAASTPRSRATAA